MIALEMLGMIVLNTPLWAWLLLLFFIKRGLAARKDRPVSLKNSILMPAIFMLLGLQQIIMDFRYSKEALLVYLGMLLVGLAVGSLLYGATQKFYCQAGQLMKKGSNVPMIVSLLNYLVRYGLTAAKSVDPGLLNLLVFNIASAMISGFTVGLFIGGILNTLKHKNLLEEKHEMA
ncbi:CcdC protein domain-containing protein [Enterococcus sp. HY326]|uniref:CcdC protein domain-containing protein n=1 Tax=Enterococcus sp. HY326 TaxID=2971265 RepID=UPI00223F5EB6|nr:CcdC protein domain-containing protein [Enterococcus sp. HY326]